MNDKVLLTALTCLEELNIHSWEHFDANEFLCSLTNLTSLGVNLPADTVALLTLTKLESLDLRVKNTDLKFSRLNRLTRLRIAKEFGKRLDPVEERRQDDIVVQHIAHMTSLKYLNVAACLYGDLDIGMLSNLVNLECLYGDSF
jgi:Leucine-rich repeat (LRR) protein